MRGLWATFSKPPRWKTSLPKPFEKRKATGSAGNLPGSICRCPDPTQSKGFRSSSDKGPFPKWAWSKSPCVSNQHCLCGDFSLTEATNTLQRLALALKEVELKGISIGSTHRIDLFYGRLIFQLTKYLLCDVHVAFDERRNIREDQENTSLRVLAQDKRALLETGVAPVTCLSQPDVIHARSTE